MTKTKEKQEQAKTMPVPVKRSAPTPMKRAVGDIKEVTYMSDHNLDILGWYNTADYGPAWSPTGGNTSLSGWMYAVDWTSHEIYEPAKALKNNYMVSSEYEGWKFPVIDVLTTYYMTPPTEFEGWKFPIVDALTGYMTSSEYGGWRFDKIDALTSQFTWHEPESPGGYGRWTSWTEGLTAYFDIDNIQETVSSPMLDVLRDIYLHQNEAIGSYTFPLVDALTAYAERVPETYDYRFPMLETLRYNYLSVNDVTGSYNFPVVDSLTSYYFQYNEMAQRYTFPVIDTLTTYYMPFNDMAGFHTFPVIDSLKTNYMTFNEGAGMYTFPVIDSLKTRYMQLDEATGQYVFPAIDNCRVSVAGRATPETGFAATYDIYQGPQSELSNKVGTINIPKDFLVKSATLNTVTVDDQPVAGYRVGDKYIDFVVNAVDSSEQAQHIYLNVKDLVDVYTAQQNATQVQLAIDANNVISATIVAGSIGTTELSAGAVTTAKLADGAVTTAKIVDANVTTAKLADSAVTNAKLGTACVTSDKLDALSSIVLIDTATTGDYVGKRYRLQVTDGRLQVMEIATPSN